MEKVITIQGPAGAGAMASGKIVAKAAVKAGFFVFGYPEYPSLIKGGLNTFQVVISDQEVRGPRLKSDQIFEIGNDNLLTAREAGKYLGLNDQFIELAIEETVGSKKCDNRLEMISGNEALAEGFLTAGGNFCAIYPMTPITNILHYLVEKNVSGTKIFQPADEIEGINTAVGASYAGAKAMVATSGGGLDLMAEGISLAGATNTPLVIINGQRVGPSTGMPTWSEQGDLSTVLVIGHGDFPRFVFAPGDVEECYELTQLAFKLTSKYRIPAIILVDKFLCESYISRYQKTEITENWQTGKLETDNRKLTTESANSYDHDDQRYPTEDGEYHVKHTKERWNRFEEAKTEIKNEIKLYGPETAKTIIVSWGSNKGPILDALPGMADTNFLHIKCLSPFPVDAVTNILKNATNVISFEENHSGQLAKLIKQETGILVKSKTKYNGKPFYKEDF